MRAVCDTEVAAVIVEPVAGNMGVVPPAPGFLEGLREITTSCGALLIFDEVMTGLRLGRAGYQSLCDVKPDLTTLGKIIGGGMPLAAYGGRAELMRLVAPDGPVYQAGTLSGNPLATAAGLTTLRLLRAPGVYESLEAKTAQLCAGIAAAAREAKVPFYGPHIGSMFTGFFADGPIDDEASARRCDTALFGRFHNAMLARGIYLAPSQFEAGFVSLAHTGDDIARTVAAARDTLLAIA